MITDDSYYLRWGVFKVSSKNGAAIAVFTSRERCWEYIDLMRQEYFFNTASMDKAEESGGRDKYSVDRVAIFTQQNTAKYFNNKFSTWPEY